MAKQQMYVIKFTIVNHDQVLTAKFKATSQKEAWDKVRKAFKADSPILVNMKDEIK